MPGKSTLFVFLIIIAALSCEKTWETPSELKPYSDTNIVSILSTPHVYESTAVRVTGMVWDIESPESEKEKKQGDNILMRFKLSDPKGYYIEVVAPNTYRIQEGDIVEVTGIFRTNYKGGSDLRKNQIEAKNIKTIKSLKEKYSKQKETRKQED